MGNQTLTIPNEQLGAILLQLVMLGLTFSAVTGSAMTTITFTGGY